MRIDRRSEVVTPEMKMADCIGREQVDGSEFVACG